jgi:hypothetical protein
MCSAHPAFDEVAPDRPDQLGRAKRQRLGCEARRQRGTVVRRPHDLEMEDHGADIGDGGLTLPFTLLEELGCGQDLGDGGGDIGLGRAEDLDVPVAKYS